MKYLSLLCFCFFILWIIISADTGTENAFVEFAHSIPYGDKIGHAFIFGIFAFLTNRAFDYASFPLKGWQCLTGSVLIFLFAGVEELTQIFFATRTFDWSDLLFDAIGILVVSFFQSKSN